MKKYLFIIIFIFAILLSSCSHEARVKRLKEDIDGYSESTFREYLVNNYHFSDIVDMFGESELREYLLNFGAKEYYLYFGEDNLKDFVTGYYYPYDFWDDLTIYGYYTEEEAMDRFLYG